MHPETPDPKALAISQGPPETGGPDIPQHVAGAEARQFRAGGLRVLRRKALLVRSLNDVTI